MMKQKLKLLFRTPLSPSRIMPSLLVRPLLTCLLLSLLFLRPTFAPAAMVPLPSLAALTNDSDFIAIVRAIDTTPTEDRLDGELAYRGFNTRFVILTVLKGAGAKPQEMITLLHFDYDPTYKDPIINGPTFMSFATAPARLERSLIIKGKRQKGGATFDAVPLYIAFLKKRADGRFEPTGGQEYSDFSFREMQPWRPDLR